MMEVSSGVPAGELVSLRQAFHGDNPGKDNQSGDFVSK